MIQAIPHGYEEKPRCVCVCVCVLAGGRERERERESLGKKQSVRRWKRKRGSKRSHRGMPRHAYLRDYGRDSVGGGVDGVTERGESGINKSKKF